MIETHSRHRATCSTSPPQRAIRIFFPNASIHYPPSRGGEIHRYQVIKNLVALGHEVHVFEPDQNPLTVKHAKKRIPVVAQLLRADAIYCRVEESPNAATRLCLPRRRMLIPRRTAVVWEMNVSLTGSVSQQVRSEQRMQEHIEELRRCAERVDVCICVTEALAQQARQILGVEHTVVLQNASDPELFRRDVSPADGLRRDAKTLRVGSIGSGTNPHHDMETILQAARIVDQQHLPIKFHNFGESEDLLGGSTVRSLRLHGAVSYLELPHYLAVMDVGLALYKVVIDHGSPLKLFDYMSSGCVPICSEGQPIHEVLDGRGAGLVGEWTADKLVETLSVLHEDRPRLAAMREAGQRLIVDKYNWRRVAERTVEMLTAAIAARRNR